MNYDEKRIFLIKFVQEYLEISGEEVDEDFIDDFLKENESIN